MHHAKRLWRCDLTRTKLNKRNLNNEGWNIKEEALLHCKVYSSLEQWGIAGRGDRFMDQLKKMKLATRAETNLTTIPQI